MKHIILLYCFFLFLLPSIIAQTVVSIKIDGTINPASADFIHSGIEKAKKEKAECLIINLNTPGGLLQSTRKIVSDILESPVPVIVFVSPGGAHAGSAGVFITLAANIAVMAPGTNIGAAHPVSMQGNMDSTMNEKATNDAAAFIRTIAEKRNRDMEWAEEAVRKSVSITENEAIKKKLIDYIAINESDLLIKVHDKEVETVSGTKKLNTAAATVLKLEMSFMDKVLNIISDPNITYILLMLGFYGLFFELYSPGTIFPGVVGVISLILAFYAMQFLPVNYAGLALIIFAIVLFILEIKIISHGLLAIGGTISLLLGSLMLIRSDSNLEFVKISLGVIIPTVVITVLFFLFIIGLGLRAQRSKIAIGSEAMKGAICEVIETLDPTGRVTIDGEIWNAESVSGVINKGEKARIQFMKDLKLTVEKIHI